MMAHHNPLIEKFRQLGESWAHLWLYAAINGSSEQDAVLVYQIISFTAGLGFVLMAAWLSRRLYADRFSSLAFFLGVISGGYMLLFFGYVENYSIFVLSVLAYSLSGLLIYRNRAPAWLILPMQALALFFHIFGVTLLPATLYLLYRQTRLVALVDRVPRSGRLVILAGGVLAALALFTYQWSRDLFFLLSFVPLYEYELTQEGYTLFSARHLLDYANLLFVLVPGLPVLLTALISLRSWREYLHPEFRWLLLAALGPLAAAFIFDPKLGMPRDWDLFAFAGVPLAVLLYTVLLACRDRLPQFRTIVVLSVSLGFVVLFSRAYAIHDPDIAVARFRDYLYLDKVKNRNSWILLKNYYEQAGDTAAANAAYAEWKGNFPEEVLMAEANRTYYVDRNIPATRALLDRIFAINPTYSDAYSFLGHVYLQTAAYDSAVHAIRLADALSPNRPNNLNNLGQAYVMLGEAEKGERLIREAARLDSSGYAAQYNLALLYAQRGDHQASLRYFADAALSSSAPDQLRKEYLRALVARGMNAEAAALFRQHPHLLTDTAFVNSLPISLRESVAPGYGSPATN